MTRLKQFLLIAGLATVGAGGALLIWSPVADSMAQSFSMHARYGRGRFGREGPPHSSSSSAPKSIENAIVAGDKSGNWWALKTDGTMLASSALTMDNEGPAPVSPLTFDGTTWFESSSAVAAPGATTDFSFVAVVNVPTISGSQTIVAKLSGTFVYLVQVNSSQRVDFYVTPTGGGTNNAVSALISTGMWFAIGGSYKQSTGLITLRVVGADTTATASGGGVQTGTLDVGVGARGGGVNKLTGSSRGVFYTEKILSDADFDRIGGGAL